MDANYILQYTIEEYCVEQGSVKSAGFGLNVLRHVCSFSVCTPYTYAFPYREESRIDRITSKKIYQLQEHSVKMEEAVLENFRVVYHILYFAIKLFPRDT